MMRKRDAGPPPLTVDDVMGLNDTAVVLKGTYWLIRAEQCLRVLPGRDRVERARLRLIRRELAARA